MFTGIVQGLAKIEKIELLDELSRLLVSFPSGALNGLTRGASIAFNGCCLTVTEFNSNGNVAYFDVMRESLRATNLGVLSEGDTVNFERAAKIGDEIGGHMMSGHISATIQLISRNDTATNCELVFECPAELKPYVLPKGYIGLNGCSLTIGASVEQTFSVHLIPETLEVTTFGTIKPGDLVNVEPDPQTQAIVDTVERYLATRS